HDVRQPAGDARAAVDEDQSVVAGDRDHVGGVAPVDDDGIGLPVPGAADRSGQVQADRGHGGAGPGGDGGGVGAAERVEDDVLDAIEVHRAAVEVADDPGPGAVGRDVEPLREVRPVNDNPVRAVAALDGVAAVARVPDERVGARAADQGVVAGA